MGKRECTGGECPCEMSTETAPLSAVRVEPVVRRDLIHKWGSKLEDFMAEIDRTGGWPTGYTHVSFFHDGPCGDRYCQFTTSPLRTEWWTTVCSSDDYYYWKLSDTKKAEIMKEARRQLIRQLG